MYKALNIAVNNIKRILFQLFSILQMHDTEFTNTKKDQTSFCQNDSTMKILVTLKLSSVPT